MRFSVRFCGVLLIIIIGSVGAEADVLTVGIGGTYGTIQDAIAAAVTMGGDNTLKLRAGTFEEHIWVTDLMTSGSLTIIGGWNVWFNSRDPDPSSTVILSASTVAASFEYGGGTIRFDGVTFTGNNPADYGGGIYALMTGDSRLILDHCIITGGFSGKSGGGAHLHLSTTASLEMLDCTVYDNEVVNSQGVFGGGVYLYLNNSATGKISWSSISGNTMATGGSSNALGGGLCVEMWGDGSLEISDCIFEDNTLGSADGLRQGSEIRVTAYSFSADDMPHIEIRRNRFHSLPSIEASSVLYLKSNNAETAISDSWFSGGADAGLVAYMQGSGILYLNNITVTDFEGISVEVNSDMTRDFQVLSLANSILWDNGTDTPELPDWMADQGNLVGTDPLFVDPADRNFRLQEGSPAIDTAVGTPQGGFSEVDLHTLDRQIGSAVDAGGSEWGGIFGNGFEAGTDRIWSSHSPN
jgi:hypothetical protein